MLVVDLLRLNLDTIESKEIRRAATRCARDNCISWYEKCPKLHACSGCKISYYCGPQCQTQDWPQHKELCLARQAYVETLNTESRIRLRTMPLPPMFTRLSLRPSDVYAELSVFRYHFMPIISLMALNAFTKGSGCPTGFRDHLLLIALMRTLKVPPSLPYWQRYRLFQAEIFDTAVWSFPTPAGYASFEEWKLKRNERLNELAREGLGSIAVLIRSSFKNVAVVFECEVKFKLGRSLAENNAERVRDWVGLLTKRIGQCDFQDLGWVIPGA
ncbi:hypothetical protein K474DRAFT_95028 [Panus rudis PR-1116 ss-1]|nr:hypothetical protein K474DRAFT_95028 [Panus rudis PR-1116 ss-1]